VKSVNVFRVQILETQPVGLYEKMLSLNVVHNLLDLINAQKWFSAIEGQYAIGILPTKSVQHLSFVADFFGQGILDVRSCEI
jgi:hypothetical protein